MLRGSLRAGVGAVVLAMAVVAAAPVAGAATPATTPKSEFLPDVEALSGAITGPGLTKPMQITGDQAGDFMSSWLAYSIYKNPPHQNPPTTAPIYHFAIKQKLGKLRTTIQVDYANGGAQGWVSMPPQAPLGWGTVSKRQWILGTNLTVAAFQRVTGGKLSPGLHLAPITTVAPASSSGSSSTPWIIAIVIGGVLVLAVIIVALRRRGNRAAAKQRGARVRAAR